MTKRIFSIFAVLGIAATIFLLSGCDSGCESNSIVESRLIGKWEAENWTSSNPETIEFTRDNKIILTYFLSSGFVEYKIESADDYTILCSSSNGTIYEIKYEDLKSNSVKFNFSKGDVWYKYNKVKTN